MIQQTKSAKISDLIKHLQRIQNTIGDVPVYLSSDSEGNSYGTIEIKDSSATLGMEYDSFGWNNKHTALIISPYQEGLEYEDVIGMTYVEDCDEDSEK